MSFPVLYAPCYAGSNVTSIWLIALPAAVVGLVLVLTVAIIAIWCSRRNSFRPDAVFGAPGEVCGLAAVRHPSTETESTSYTSEYSAGDKDDELGIHTSGNPAFVNVEGTENVSSACTNRSRLARAVAANPVGKITKLQVSEDTCERHVEPGTRKAGLSASPSPGLPPLGSFDVGSNMHIINETHESADDSKAASHHFYANIGTPV